MAISSRHCVLRYACVYRYARGNRAKSLGILYQLRIPIRTWPGCDRVTT
jgi:hypothetical protein